MFDWVTILTAASAFLGGIAAVFVTKVLEFYRRDLEQARHIKETLRMAVAVVHDEIPSSRNEEHMRKLTRELEEIYVKKDYLLTTEGKNTVENIFESTDLFGSDDDGYKILGMLSEEEAKYILGGMESLSTEDEDQNVVDVDFWGATKRFFGYSDPY